MTVKNKAKVWMRQGDNADYQDFDGMYDAGSELGGYYAAVSSTPEVEMPEISRHGEYGIDSSPGYENYNYISLFWGDDDAQPLKGISLADLAEFKRGVRAGGDIGPPLHSRKYSPRAATPRKTHVGKPSGLGGLR
jgi:hypothetical protein